MLIPAGMPANLPFVILDEFLLIPASGQEQRDLLELMDYRSGYASTIFCPQFMPEGWHDSWVAQPPQNIHSDTLTGGSCLTQVLSVLLLMPYSRSGCIY